jgi:hypothetical protein
VEKTPLVYPNPANDKLNIQLPGEMFDVFITDIHGRYIQQLLHCTGTAELGLRLAPGCYVAEVKTRSNRNFRSKFIIN